MSCPMPLRDPGEVAEEGGRAPEFSRQNFSWSGHFDPQTDVILGAEYISDHEARVLVAAQQLSVLLGTGLLACLVALRHTQSQLWWLADHALPIINLATGAVCLAALSACWALCGWRFLQARHQQRRWSHRRRRLAATTAVELGVQSVNITAWLALNGWALTQESPGVAWGRTTAAVMLLIWTSWNTVFLLLLVQVSNVTPFNAIAPLVWLASRLRLVGPRLQRAMKEGDPLLLDLPWRLHAPKLAFWAATEACIIALFVNILQHLGPSGPASVAAGAASSGGGRQGADCRSDPARIGLTTAMFASSLAQLALYYALLYFAFRAFKQRPYAPFRVPNLILRFHFKARLPASVFFFLTIVLLWFAQLDLCAALMESGLGITPMQSVGTVLVIATSQLFLPSAPHAHEQAIALHVWLQDFASLEADVPRKIAQRQARSDEPMYCFETALKLLFWSCLVYTLEEAAGDDASLHTALGLLGLTHHEVIWERRWDSKCVVAWGPSAVLVAFRGTASLSNVLSDIKVWRVPHPPKWGSCCLGTRPLVHKGFWLSYARSGLRDRVLARLEAVMGCEDSKGGSGGGGMHGAGSGSGGRGWRTMFTGHSTTQQLRQHCSLGGALATLAAYDVACTFNGRCEVQCYTFGAPRTGNHAFRRDYGQCVPNTWQVVNDQDAVAKAGKFGFGALALFKHVGHRVLVNAAEDLVVRPAFLEASVHRTFRASVRQHLLTSYMASFRAILQAQFANKGSVVSQRALQQLGRSEYVQEMLMGALGLHHTTMSLLRPSFVSEAPAPGDTDILTGAPVEQASAAEIAAAAALPAAVEVGAAPTAAGGGVAAAPAAATGAPPAPPSPGGLLAAAAGRHSMQLPIRRSSVLTGRSSVPTGRSSVQLPTVRSGVQLPVQPGDIQPGEEQEEWAGQMEVSGPWESVPSTASHV